MRDWKEHANEAQMDAAGKVDRDITPGEAHYNRSVEDFYAKQAEALRAPPIPRGVRLAREGAGLQQGGPQSVSPFVYLSEAHSSVHSLLNRVSILANRLVGPQPEASSQVKDTTKVEGCLGAARQASVEITDAVSTMNRLLSAIERELP